MGLSKEQNEFVAALYNEMSTNLYVYAMNAFGNQSQAEEAVQETFRIACSNVDKLMSSDKPKGWLMNTLKNVINNTRKKQARMFKMVMTAVSLEDLVVATPGKLDDVDLLYSDLLEPEEFDLLKKIVIDRYSILDAAQELRIIVAACKKRVQRAKKKLKKILEDIENKDKLNVP